MKKILIFVISLALLTSVNTKAKAGVGVLENKEYNKHELAEFQQALLDKTKLKSGIITITQANMIEVFKRHIGILFPGENFEDVVKNSTVETLPADFQNNHKVGYLGADNTDGMDWFSRPPKTELGAEEGLKYKGKFWASKYCWNPIFPTPSQVNQITYSTPPQQNLGTGNNGGGNTNTITINPGSNQGREMSASEFYMSYSMGRNDRQTDLIVDANIFKDMQNSKQCCQTGVSSGQSQMQMASMPVQYVTAQPQVQQVGYSQQKVPFGQTFGGQLLANVGGEVIGEGLNRLIYGPEKVQIVGSYSGYSQRSYYGNGGGGGYNNGTGGPVQGGFNSTSNGIYNNGGGTGSGGIGGPVQGNGFNW